MNWLLSVLRELTKVQVSISDIVDIIMVAILIYALLVLLRGTRAMQMLWGILAIAVLYLTASAFGLLTLSTILEKALVFFPFAIIVLFQQDIRRMLTAFVPSGWMRLGSFGRGGSVLLNELSLAAQALASERVGALIAIERRDSLISWADTGIPLQALFSYDLLLNIFVPGTPLHDGAVIIRRGRIAAAGCFLPLTTSSLTSELGTRHRAAIGLSEETDALVIVVSEETGTISLAIEGQLLRPLDHTNLRNALAENLFQLHAAGEASA